MIDDLKIIKKKYGEEMMHLCREMFTTMLDIKKGMLSKLMLEHFDESKTLYKDIVENNLEEEFKNYIYSFIDMETNQEEISKSPEELLKEVGYTLYECKTEEDIQSFKKYYKNGEELCTFNGGRLNRCYVFFAVKDNIETIKRENFPNPKRQDEYGTSVISIQFTKNNSYTLSIKNRYNHIVNNPDATYSNNLDNITEGLTRSFEKYYNMIQSHKNNGFEIPGYVMVNGKYYKYNYEINNIYYCTNNIIIDNYEVKGYEKEQYIIADYFIIDLKEKRIRLYDEKLEDSFEESFGEIRDIQIQKEGQTKKVIVTPKNGEEIIITLDKENNIIGLVNNNVKIIGDCFLYYNKKLQKFIADNLEEIGDACLHNNTGLIELNLPKVKIIGYNFLYENEKLKIFRADNLEKIGNYCLKNNEDLIELNLPNAKIIGDYFLFYNEKLQTFSADNLEEIGYKCLYSNTELVELSLPSAKIIGDDFLFYNEKLQTFKADNLEEIGNYCLDNNNNIYFDEENNINNEIDRKGNSI